MCEYYVDLLNEKERARVLYDVQSYVGTRCVRIGQVGLGYTLCVRVHDMPMYLLSEAEQFYQ